MFIVFHKGEPPILSDSPEVDGDEVRSVRVDLDPRSMKCLRALAVDLGPNFEVASMLAALWQHGYHLGQRSR
jgi:hypothetical protein